MNKTEKDFKILLADGDTPQILNKEQVNKLLQNGEDDGKDQDGYNSEEDPIPVVIFDSELHFIKQMKAVDIVFLVDSTASMKPLFKGVKRFIRKLIWDATKCLTQYLVDEVDVLMVGLVEYRDHPPQETSFVSKVTCDLTSDFKTFKQSVMKMNAAGGGDGPEAVLDGLSFAINNISWRSESFKFIYHILDSPPHGSTFTNKEDAFPDGCPCELDHDNVLLDLRNLGVEYNIVKLTNDVDTMIEVFSGVIKIDVMNPDIKIDQNKSSEQKIVKV